MKIKMFEDFNWEFKQYSKKYPTKKYIEFKNYDEFNIGKRMLHYTKIENNLDFRVLLNNYMVKVYNEIDFGLENKIIEPIINVEDETYKIIKPKKLEKYKTFILLSYVYEKKGDKDISILCSTIPLDFFKKTFNHNLFLQGYSDGFVIWLNNEIDNLPRPKEVVFFSDNIKDFINPNLYKNFSPILRKVASYELLEDENSITNKINLINNLKF